MSEIQSVLFDKKKWTIPTANEWLIYHNIKPMKMEHTTNRFYRYRIRDPTKFSRIRTIETRSGVYLLIGFP